MQTEDETFRILKRIPFTEMNDIVTEYIMGLVRTGTRISGDINEEIFTTHEWTHDEYAKEYSRRYVLRG